MAKEAYPFLLPLAIITGLCLLFKLDWLALFFGAVWLFVAFFFRDPNREIPADGDAVVSPADGKVVDILSLEGGRVRLSIFLSVFNVHINRAPIAGTVESVQYCPGKFKVAYDESASLENEQNIITIANGGQRIKFSQIAGILARRIVCWCHAGQSLEKGQRVGLIKFGSRVDVFFPQSIIPTVKIGDKVKGGSSIIGRIKHD
jgi:phosphatidylserine decarboxylase